MFATFTEFLSKKNNRNTYKEENQDEDRPPSTCHEFDLFTPVEPTEVAATVEEQEKQVQETNLFNGKKLKLRFREMDEHMSEAQKKMYMYILTQDTSIKENDAYTIALRMPPDVNWEVTQTFEECVREFKHIQADVSASAYYITRYTKKLHAYRKIRMKKYKKKSESRVDIDFKTFNEMLTPNS
ncbi:hypothetical protein [Bacillus sp. FDAARGOS_1420]|uniref:hypothetical protein n=1 Tax=unclassified Bacillus (in: firmicutes) TaxID=185979 RepID=UPI001C5A9558|nr:hypothetical protein [Bacillus sp. FDAARGOS_1420]MBW3496814.1 hypothetical protein [Bacillus sp. FDAARGOS_1420]